MKSRRFRRWVGMAMDVEGWWRFGERRRVGKSSGCWDTGVHVERTASGSVVSSGGCSLGSQASL